MSNPTKFPDDTIPAIATAAVELWKACIDLDIEPTKMQSATDCVICAEWGEYPNILVHCAIEDGETDDGQYLEAEYFIVVGLLENDNILFTINPTEAAEFIKKALLENKNNGLTP